MLRLSSSLFIYLRTSSASPCLSPWAMDPSYTSLHIGRRSPAAAIAGFATAVMNASQPLCCCMQLSTSASAGPLALDDCFVMAMRAAIARTRFDRATVEFEINDRTFFPLLQHPPRRADRRRRRACAYARCSTRRSRGLRPLAALRAPRRSATSHRGGYLYFLIPDLGGG